MNQVQCIGRLSRDIELQEISNSNCVLNNSIAIPRRKVKEGEANADFIAIVAWNGTARLIAKYLTKGDEIGIVGQLNTRQYTDKESGKPRYITEIIVNEVTFLRKKQATADTIEVKIANA